MIRGAPFAIFSGLTIRLGWCYNGFEQTQLDAAIQEVSMEGYFEKEFVLTPDYATRGQVFRPMARSQSFRQLRPSTRRIGVGGAAMAKRGEFWLTVHSRVDFVGRAHLMQTLNAKTWPEPCDETSIRCFRSYSLNCGDTPGRAGQNAVGNSGTRAEGCALRAVRLPARFPIHRGSRHHSRPGPLPRRFCARGFCAHLYRPSDG